MNKAKKIAEKIITSANYEKLTRNIVQAAEEKAKILNETKKKIEKLDSKIGKAQLSLYQALKTSKDEDLAQIILDTLSGSLDISDTISNRLYDLLEELSGDKIDSSNKSQWAITKRY